MRFLVLSAIFLIGLQQTSTTNPNANKKPSFSLPSFNLMDMVLGALKAARNETVTQEMCTSKQINQCIDQSRKQAGECFTECFGEFAELLLLSKPGVLKQCIKNKAKLLDKILPCVKDNLQSCAADENSTTKVPTIDFNEFYNKLEKTIDQTAEFWLNHFPSPDLKHIVAPLKSSRRCMKTCFMYEKNPQRNCFAQASCMPNITDDVAKKMYMTCGQDIDWWKELGSICDCTARAGMDALKDYCGLLRAWQHG